MASLRERRVAWEWIVAALFAAPSLTFLVRQILVHGDEFGRALANVMTAAQSETADAFFFVDGLPVFASPLSGAPGALAAHALLTGRPMRTVAR